MTLAKLSIAAKLYVDLRTAGHRDHGAVGGRHRQCRAARRADRRIRNRPCRHRNVERVNSLIYAVVMESRGIYMSPDMPTAEAYAAGLTRFNDQIGKRGGGLAKIGAAEDADVFDAVRRARRKQFHDFRRELVRRGTEISPAAGREWGDNDANRTVRTALNNDLDKLGQLYAKRVARVSMLEIEQRHRQTALLDDGAWRASRVMLAMAGALVIIARSRGRSPMSPASPKRSPAATQSSLCRTATASDEIGALARSIAVFQDAMRRNVELNKTVRRTPKRERSARSGCRPKSPSFGTRSKRACRTRPVVRSDVGGVLAIDRGRRSCLGQDRRRRSRLG